MEQTEQKQKGWQGAGPGRPLLTGQTCHICINERSTEFNELLVESGATIPYIAAKLGDPFNVTNIKRHLRNCLQKTWHQLRLEKKVTLSTDVDNRFALLMNEAEEAYFAAKAVLLVDGELNLNIRDHEINVVYLDYNDRNEKTGEPKLKTALLAKLLADVQDGGYHIQHSYIKAEDARKTLRETLSQIESLLDRFAKITGAYQQDRKNEHDALEETRILIRGMAAKYGTTYEAEAAAFLKDYGHRLTPTVRGMLAKESQDTLGALGAGDVGGFLPSPIIDITPQNHSESISEIADPAADPEQKITEKDISPDHDEETSSESGAGKEAPW